MSHACIIDGQRCTQCCRAIVLPYSRRRIEQNQHDDAVFIRRNWVQISRRRAKKKNPYFFRHRGAPSALATYWVCTKVTDDGCSVHADRPQVCRGYPFYVQDRGGRPSEYHPQCTEWQRIPITEITNPLDQPANTSPNGQEPPCQPATPQP